MKFLIAGLLMAAAVSVAADEQRSPTVLTDSMLTTFQQPTLMTAHDANGVARQVTRGVKRYVTVARVNADGKTETFCTDNPIAARRWLQANENDSDEQ